MENAMVKISVNFVQITGVGDNLYALDNSGKIWKYMGSEDWERLVSPEIEQARKGRPDPLVPSGPGQK